MSKVQTTQVLIQLPSIAHCGQNQIVAKRHKESRSQKEENEKDEERGRNKETNILYK